MPDLDNKGEDGHIAHYDELCIACKNLGRETCPLLKVLYELKIETTTGMKVWGCGLYHPDKESPHYIERGEPIDEAAIKELARKVERLWGK